jgi:hypothetical protein
LGTFGPEAGRFNGFPCTSAIADAIEYNFSKLQKAAGNKPFSIPRQDPKSVKDPDDILCLYIVQGGHRRWMTDYISKVLVNGPINPSDPFSAKIQKRWATRHPHPVLWAKVYSRGIYPNYIVSFLSAC